MYLKLYVKKQKIFMPKLFKKPKTPEENFPLSEDDTPEVREIKLNLQQQQREFEAYKGEPITWAETLALLKEAIDDKVGQVADLAERAKLEDRLNGMQAGAFLGGKISVPVAKVVAFIPGAGPFVAAGILKAGVVFGGAAGFIRGHTAIKNVRSWLDQKKSDRAERLSGVDARKSEDGSKPAEDISL